MKKQSRIKPVSVPAFRESKNKEKKLTMLTAYDFLWARLFDEAGIDSLLVGDSLGMVVQGKSTTVPVTMSEIIYHAEMVVRAVNRALVVVDMPYLSYQVSIRKAIANAGRIIKETGASAVKLEGGVSQAETIAALSRIEIPVVAHLGMRPQSVHHLGSMGKIQRDEEQLMEDALAVEQAGAFAVVLELIPREIAEKITKAISIPTIGIGAGPACDGQVLVSPDMLGLSKGFQPKFLKRFAELYDLAFEATQQYIEEVQTGQFPDESHSH